MEREKFSSRLGFILISAGCAIGLGNVWRFPYIVGQYGGAAFVLIYLLFLLVLGLPVVVMEFAVGRASQKSAALSFQPFHQLARPLCAFFLSYWITQTFTGSLYRQFPFHPMAKLLVSAGAVSGIYLLLLILTAGWERK